MIGIITDGAFLIAGNWARVRRVSLFSPGGHEGKSLGARVFFSAFFFPCEMLSCVTVVLGAIWKPSGNVPNDKKPTHCDGREKRWSEPRFSVIY